MESVMLSNGVKMPVLGYGVYQVAAEECERCVLDALKVGYRSLDTAQSYFNEAQVGSAMRKSGVPREEIFLTTKVWVEHYGYEAAKVSVLESMEKLQTDYLDLVLLHQPFSDYYGAYRALEDLYIQGRVRAIGVSNFYPDRLVDLASFAHIRPMVNQVEIHPYHQQAEAKTWMEKYSVQAYDRPGIIQFLDSVKARKVDALLVKDLSRLGRDYIQVGRFLDDLNHSGIEVFETATLMTSRL